MPEISATEASRNFADLLDAVELEVGIHLASDGHRADRRTAVESIVNSVRVLPYDLDVAHRHAVLLAHTLRGREPTRSAL